MFRVKFLPLVVMQIWRVCLLATVNLMIIQKKKKTLVKGKQRVRKWLREMSNRRSHSTLWGALDFHDFHDLPLFRLIFDFSRVFRELFATLTFSSTTDVREFATIFLTYRAATTPLRANVQIPLSTIGAKGMNRDSYFWILGRMSTMKYVDFFKVKAAAEYNQWISTS